MNDCALLPVRGIAALPPRLAELLWADPLADPVDSVVTVLYGSSMNDFAEDRGQRAEGGETLFRFLETANQLYARIARALAKVGLSYAKYQVLTHLREAACPLSLGTLAEGQNCARSNITQLIDRLESEGLVRRVDDPADRRGVLAELTPDGASLAADGRAQIDQVRAEFAAAFTTGERAELSRLLDRIQ